MKFDIDVPRLKEAIVELCSKHKWVPPLFFLSIFVGGLYIANLSQEKEKHVYHHKAEVNFEGGRILGNNKAIYEKKEKIHAKKIGKLAKSQKRLQEHLKKLEGLLLDLEKKKAQGNGKVETESNSQNLKDVQKENESAKEQGKKAQNGSVQFSPSPDSIRPGQIPNYNNQFEGIKPKKVSKRRRNFNYKKGPSTISFPVQSKRKSKGSGVKLPSGSYVKVKLLTGVEAAESRAIPVLLQADYAFFGPNKTKIDLSGCFLIAKSTGNLSIERVEMQATKISCVSKSGRTFEKKLNGFVADAVDSSFGVIGKVNSKQDRVASMAFLSSVVEGVGKAIQQAQTTSSTNAVGGTSSVISGSQAKYMAAGGASNAASHVTQWYLKHAQNLLPTINVGSGQDVWIVIQDAVDLPNWYFRQPKKNKKSPGHYSYLSRFLD